MEESQRRVPLRNMIYIADGPSDVPCFSILNQNGGKTLGVYTLEPRDNHKQVKQLQEQGRIQGMAEADYRPGRAAYLWLMDSLEQITRGRSWKTAARLLPRFRTRPATCKPGLRLVGALGPAGLASSSRYASAFGLASSIEWSRNCGEGSRWPPVPSAAV